MADDKGSKKGDEGRKRRRKQKRISVESNGQAFVHATFNNTIVTLTDTYGNTISWASAGTAGFKGSRKNTPYAAQQAARKAGQEAYDLGLRRVDVYVKGPGSGRESAVRGLDAVGFEVATIKDVTPIPHNGCRPPKRRRV